MAYGDLPCPHNDDEGGTLVSNSYMMKMRIDIKEDASVVEELAARLHQWGYGFERRIQQAKGGQYGGRPRGPDLCARVEPAQV